MYVLDANVFIEASRRYYAFDLVPKFWEVLIQYASNGRILSIDRVKKELERGKDDLAAWVKKDFSNAFASTDEEAIERAFGDIMTWVVSQDRFLAGAKAVFADDPDGWLVAYAKVNGYCVVTQEVAAPYARKEVKIPDVCQAFDLRYVDTFEMLRELGVRLA